MLPSFTHFLEEVADRLLELADRAPDIGAELRRFAADLIEMAAAGARKDPFSDLPD
jgi:hypothetical protein